MANWKQRERKEGEIVDRQNKRINSCCTQSASYGSMTFWKNKDFWKTMLMYFAGGLFLVLMLMGLAKTTD